MTRNLNLLDATDRRLIALLQINARESVAQLARTLGIARTTVLARLERLEKSGVIAGYAVRLGHDVTDNSLLASVGITLQPKAGSQVLKQLQQLPEVQLLCSVSGEHDYLAWLRASTPQQLDMLLDQIGGLDGVIRTKTSIVLAKKIDRGGVM